MTDQPMDYRDYLIRQQQQERIAQRFDALFTKDEDHAAAATQGIENQAYHDSAGGGCGLRRRAGVSDRRDHPDSRSPRPDPERHRAREGRAEAARRPGKQLAELVAKIAPTKSKHDSAQATLKDPAAKREALIARFPALRR